VTGDQLSIKKEIYRRDTTKPGGGSGGRSNKCKEKENLPPGSRKTREIRQRRREIK